MGYLNKKRRKGTLFWVLILLIILFSLSIVFLGMGKMDIPRKNVIKILFSSYGQFEGRERVERAVVVKIRLPRILSAIFIGMALSVSGVLFQAILSNPMAGPYTVGVSTGAAFGATLAIFFGIPFITGFAFLGGVFALLAVLILSRAGGSISPTTLILSGIILSSILQAGISFLKNLAGESVGLIISFLLGSLVAKTWDEIRFAIPMIIIFSLLPILFSKELNILALCGKGAKEFGVEEEKIRLIMLVDASLLTVISVSISGIIAFLGLVVPHIVRMIVGPDHKKLIPMSALSGAVLLLIADNFIRIWLPHEIPVGILTTLIGGPFFLYIYTTRVKGIGYGTG